MITAELFSALKSSLMGDEPPQLPPSSTRADFLPFPVLQYRLDGRHKADSSDFTGRFRLCT